MGNTQYETTPKYKTIDFFMVMIEFVYCDGVGGVESMIVIVNPHPHTKIRIFSFFYVLYDKMCDLLAFKSDPFSHWSLRTVRSNVCCRGHTSHAKIEQPTKIASNRGMDTVLHHLMHVPLLAVLRAILYLHSEESSIIKVRNRNK